MKKVLISLSALALLGSSSSALATTAPAVNATNPAANAAAAKEAAKLAKKAAAAKAKAAKLARAAAAARAKADANPGNAKLAALAAKAEQQAAAAEAEASSYEAAAAAASSGDLAAAAAAAAVSVAPAASAAAAVSVAPAAAVSAVSPAASVELLDDDEGEIEEVDSSDIDQGPSKAERRASIAAQRKALKERKAAYEKSLQEAISDDVTRAALLAEVKKDKSLEQAKADRRRAQEDLGLVDGTEAKLIFNEMTADIKVAKGAARTSLPGGFYVEDEAEGYRKIEAAEGVKLEKDKLFVDNKAASIEVLEKAINSAAVVFANANRAAVVLANANRTGAKSGKAASVDEALKEIAHQALVILDYAREAKLAKAYEQLGRVQAIEKASLNLKNMNEDAPKDKSDQPILDEDKKQIKGSIKAFDAINTGAALTTAAATTSDANTKTLQDAAQAAYGIKEDARKISEGLEGVLELKRKRTKTKNDEEVSFEVGADEASTTKLYIASQAAKDAHTKALATYKDLEAAALTAKNDATARQELENTWHQNDEEITRFNDTNHDKQVKCGSHASECNKGTADLVGRVVSETNGNASITKTALKYHASSENDKSDLQKKLDEAKTEEIKNMDEKLKETVGNTQKYKATASSQAKELDEALKDLEAKFEAMGMTEFSAKEEAKEANKNNKLEGRNEQDKSAQDIRRERELSSAASAYEANEAANKLVDESTGKDLFKNAEDAISEASKASEQLIKEQLSEMEAIAIDLSQQDQALDNE